MHGAKVKKLYMFRTVPLSIISSFSLYAQQCYMSYRFADSLPEQDQDGTHFHPDTIGNRTRDLPACSAASQPTAPPRATSIYVQLLICIILLFS